MLSFNYPISVSLFSGSCTGQVADGDDTSSIKSYSSVVSVVGGQKGVHLIFVIMECVISPGVYMWGIHHIISIQS